MLRALIAESKECPATMALGAAWVVVFLLMIAARLDAGSTPTMAQLLIGNIGGAHRYGDMTLAELFRGEAWRALTCTFVHYNLLHIGMNLYGLYQLGGLVETWYGSGQLVAIYVVVGGGGNLLSGLIRRGLGSNPEVHSGGGSTVVLGLVALCAIVGWRMRTRIGDYLRSQMVAILLLTALLGLLLPIIDNWGHAGGAIVGAAIGLGHRTLVTWASRPWARWAGVGATALLVACGTAQLRDNRVEDAARGRQLAELRRWKAAESVEVTLSRVGQFYHQAVLRSEFEHSRLVPKSFLGPDGARPKGKGRDPIPFIDLSDADFRAAQRQHLALLESTAPMLASGPTADAYRRVAELLRRVFDRPPTTSAYREFQVHLAALIRRAQQERVEAKARYERVALRRGPFG